MITRYRPWEDPADTRARRRELIIQQTALALLTRRLQNIANAPDSKLISAGAAQSPARELAWSTTVSAVGQEGDAAIRTLGLTPDEEPEGENAASPHRARNDAAI